LSLLPFTVNAQTFTVAERGGNVVSLIDAADGSRSIISDVTAPDGIVMIDPATALVTQFVNPGDLIEIDLATGAQTVVAGGFGRSQGVILDGQGNALIAEQDGGRIAAVNLGTGAVSTFIGGLNAPIDIVFEDADNVLISEAGTGVIVRVNLTTGTRTNLATGLGIPTDLVLDGNGNVLVTEFLADRVTQVDLATGQTTTLSTISGPHSIQLDPNGDIYILSFRQGTISRREPDGNLTTVASGMINPTWFVFQAAPGQSPVSIPALSQWGLAILGLLVVMITMLRRKRMA
jgi:sugar lactone lactonase YvrE